MDEQNTQADDEISIGDVEFDDKIPLVALLGMSSKDLKAFCQQQSQAVLSQITRSDEDASASGTARHDDGTIEEN